jgi:hypothetical protein
MYTKIPMNVQFRKVCRIPARHRRCQRRHEVLVRAQVGERI